MIVTGDLQVKVNCEWILPVGYLHLLTGTCVLTLILALANLHLDTCTWILALAHSHLDASHFLRAHCLCTPSHFLTHTKSFPAFTRGKHVFGPIVV